MSTTTISATPHIARAIFHRFVWKEYRMLRGFWLAVAGLTVIEQLIATQLAFDRRGVPNWCFGSAWGAAALYAVGAAVTLFSAEREDRTLSFLQQLPGRWRAMFVGKVALALLSAVALAVTLSIAGWLVAGQTWPNAADIRISLAVGGVAIVEATVWGLLFSLWLKQPLLAAVTAIGAASIGAQLAIAATPAAHHAFTFGAYHTAVPMRLLLSLGVLLIDIALAARWLGIARGASRGLFWQHQTRRNPAAERRAKFFNVVTAQHPRRRILARLLWQTWRESWKPMLVIVPIATMLMIAMTLPLIATQAGLHQFDLPWPLLCLPFVAALYGAMVFRADQRRDHRQFLVAHAARPRYVWIARHLVWLPALAVLSCVIYVAILAVVGSLVGGQAARLLDSQGDYLFAGRHFPSDWDQLWELQFVATMAWRVSVSVWCLFFTAYACGQFFSMLLRREILAGFLALLFAVLLAAWTLVMGYWGLSAWWSVLPLGVGAMVATWLRAPDWLVGRLAPRTWLAPLAALVFPAVCIVGAIPAARLAQLNVQPPDYPYLREPLETSAAALDETSAAGRETALMYERLHAKLKVYDDESTMGLAELAEARIDAALRIDAGLTAENISQLIEITRRPECRFAHADNWHEQPHSRYEQLVDLRAYLLQDAKHQRAAGDFDAEFERYLAIIRLDGHALSHQRPGTWSNIQDNYIYQGRRQSGAHPNILRWAGHSDQTSERLKDAIDQLQDAFAARPHPREAVLAVHEFIRQVVLGEQLPSFLNNEYRPTSKYLAYLANELPRERERALVALDHLTTQYLNFVDAISNGLEGGSLRPWYHPVGKEFRKLVGHLPERPVFVADSALCKNHWPVFQRQQQLALASSSSWLVMDEFRDSHFVHQFIRGMIDAEIRRRGLLTQLALLAYRLDHGQYPETLDDLAPKYLRVNPFDPFSGSLFEYRREGLELALYRYANQRIAPADTPLFWSVGAGKSELGEQQLTTDDEGNLSLDWNWETYGAKSSLPHAEMVYGFHPTDRDGWYWYPNLVFPLPK